MRPGNKVQLTPEHFRRYVNGKITICRDINDFAFARRLFQNQYQQAGLEDAAHKFFACTNVDMAERAAEEEANRPVDPKTLIKQQFVMSKSGAQPGKLHFFIPNKFVKSHTILTYCSINLQ